MELIFVTIAATIVIVLILVVSKYKTISIELGNWFKLKAKK
ncbi:hypothetical protein SDC9_137337 [bioreactor metagenome]|uniref:Uncharacterized protein n=1 Tax=bioreactor metagenome TaxID=1076179 RepID=A0A645DLP6_9ZZZZ